MKKRNFLGNGSTWATLLIGFVFFVCIASLMWLRYDYDEVKAFSSEVVSLVDAKKIDSIEISGNQVQGQLVGGGRFFSNIVLTESFLNKLTSAGANVVVSGQGGASWLSYLLGAIFLLMLGGVAFFFFSFFKTMQGGPGGNKLFSVGQSKARFYPADTVKTKFSDVAGFMEVKDELRDVVEFLKNPDKFRKIGAKIPRGVLLSGAPGNGKTLLARAVAGEATCPFLTISGSDFVEVFVGVGASRVRDLFSLARKHAPVIVFIDEIDTVGRQRGVGLGGGNDEREQTLNQLLSEMDGFATQPGEVIVLAATNRSDVLDKALMRPGRFDRLVQVPLPDVKTREKILELHAKGVSISPAVDFFKIARGTPGWSGADLANLINEAALNSAKQMRDKVIADDFEFARDKLSLGATNRSLTRTKEELKATAYHESGHALMNLLLPATDPFHKVTIVARGHALGVSMSIPEGDVHTQNEDALFARIIVCLGGLLAEKMFLKSQGSGVSSDLEQATKIARVMVCRYGMSSLGPISLGLSRDPYAQPEYSQATAEKVDLEVQAILAKAQDKGEKLMSENKEKLEKLAQELVLKETLAADEVYALLDIEPRQSHSFQPDAELVGKSVKSDESVPEDSDSEKKSA